MRRDHGGSGLAAVVLAVFVGAHCSPTPDPEEPSADGACAAACSTLVQLGCEEGEPTEGGATCEDVCANGMAARYDLACVANLLYCDLEVCSLDPAL